MKKLLLLCLVLAFATVGALAQQAKKKSKSEKAKLTPEQRMAYENDRVHDKKPDKKDTTKDKVKRQKKQNKQAARMKGKR